VKWTNPTTERYKCYINALFSSSSNIVGIVICLKDIAGEFVIAKTDCFSPLCDVDVGEDVGLHTTLDWIVDLWFDNVDFALDIKDNSEFGCIISACKQLFHINF